MHYLPSLYLFVLLSGLVASTNVAKRNLESDSSVDNAETSNVDLVVTENHIANLDEQLDSPRPRKRRSRITRKTMAQYQMASTDGFYHIVFKNPKPKTGKYQVKTSFTIVSRIHILVMDSHDLFALVHFPFSTAIVTSFMFPEGEQRSLDFKHLVPAVECATKVSRFLYEQNGFMQGVLNVAFMGAGKKAVLTGFMKCFVPALLVFIDRHGMSELEPLRPFIGHMLGQTSRLPYFRTALQLVKAFLAENYAIEFEMLEPKQVADLAKCEEIDLSLMNAVYFQLHSHNNQCLQLFFTELWRQITVPVNGSKILLQFHTLKFTQVLEEMVNKPACLDSSNPSYIFNPFAKFSIFVPLSKFFRIAILVDHLKPVVEKICRLMIGIRPIVCQLSIVAQKHYFMFLEYFVGFLNFYLKFSCYLEYRRFVLNYATKDEAIQNMEALKPMIDSLHSLATSQVRLHKPAVENMFSDADLTDLLMKLQVVHPTAGSVIDCRLGISNRKSAKNNFTSISSCWSDPYERSVDILSHTHDSIDADSEKYSYCRYKAVLIINRAMKILEKEKQDWNTDDATYLDSIYDYNHFFHSKKFFDHLFLQADAEDSLLLLKWVMDYSIYVQRMYYENIINQRQAKSRLNAQKSP